MDKKEYSVVKFVCVNCLNKTYALKDKQGIIRLECPICGAKTVSSRKSRRKIVLEVTAPDGQVVLDDEN